MAIRSKLTNKLAATLKPYLRLLGEPPRESFIEAARAEIALGPLSGEELEFFARRVQEAAARLERVRWVTVDRTRRRVTVGFEPHAYTLQELERVVELAEVIARLRATLPAV